MRAMESGVEWVRLGEAMTLDIKALMEYRGQGDCGEVDCHMDTTDRYREQLRTWAASRNWALTYDYDNSFEIMRI